ncbi:hypothetical protein JYB87_07245 [Shewanella avicenniae]|uniref:Transposase n=1 Tax=Shewanella avicenniae TaxID=2814294 RepID=A0ABX7QVJ8_9GAMM|nr:hypothetical protein [Shewanella avicenniae]QSX35005.1 hypothetical protein JYB87_07245 [Shewanella avicenniae]
MQIFDFLQVAPFLTGIKQIFVKVGNKCVNGWNNFLFNSAYLMPANKNNLREKQIRAICLLDKLFNALKLHQCLLL